MKRNELVEGAELYCANLHDWKTGTEGFRSGRAKVLAVEPYKKIGGTWGFKADFHRVPKGNGVLVEIDGHKDVVPLAHLRCSYEDGVRQMRERREAAQAEYAEQSREREAQAEAMQALASRAFSMGVAVARDGDAFVVTPDALAKLLDLAENGCVR